MKKTIFIAVAAAATASLMLSSCQPRPQVHAPQPTTAQALAPQAFEVTYRVPMLGYHADHDGIVLPAEAVQDYNVKVIAAALPSVVHDLVDDKLSATPFDGNSYTPTKGQSIGQAAWERHAQMYKGYSDQHLIRACELKFKGSAADGKSRLELSKLQLVSSDPNDVLPDMAFLAVDASALSKYQVEGPQAEKWTLTEALNSLALQKYPIRVEMNGKTYLATEVATTTQAEQLIQSGNPAGAAKVFTLKR